MPHLIVDYSANLEQAADIAGLCEALRACAANLEAFPKTGIRVRAFQADHVSIADGNPEHGYVDISVRLREGRPKEVKEHAAATLFEAVKAHLAEVIATRPVMVSLEVREIDAKLAPKINTVRSWIERNTKHG